MTDHPYRARKLEDRVAVIIEDQKTFVKLVRESGAEIDSGPKLSLTLNQLDLWADLVRGTPTSEPKDKDNSQEVK